MNVIEAYARQYKWRSWPTVLGVLPNLEGQLVLDLGCGIGDLAADLSARGARVIGFDLNGEFVAYARSRHIPETSFRVADLHTFRDRHNFADGVWSSFTAAYFPSLRDAVAGWTSCLRPGGWMALIEVDDLFGHEPLLDRTRDLLNRYVINSLEHSRYDFRMGRKLRSVLEECGLNVTHDFTVPDAELSFSGRASPDVLDSWRIRFDRMFLLRDFCGLEFGNVRDDFLKCLIREDHWCHSRVRCCIGIKHAMSLDY